MNIHIYTYTPEVHESANNADDDVCDNGAENNDEDEDDDDDVDVDEDGD